MNSTDIADQLWGNYRPDHWMRQRKWWWSFFIWVIGVALVNAYKIYECIWNEEKAKLSPGHPKKMTQVEFREQLVYDLVFGKKAAAVAVSGGSLVSAFSHASTEQAGEYDLTSYQGVKDYLEENASRMIMKERLESGYFKRRLNGLRHNWVPCEREVLARCQYCYYILNNKVAKNKYKHYEKELKQNRDRVHRCLVCHVNLCPRCEPIFHGVDLSNYTVK